MHRLAWKNELIAFREAQLAAPPVALPAELDDVRAVLDQLAYRRVHVTGRFLHEREIYLAASRDGEVGFHVITPLRREEGSTVLVDRGWVPAEARAAERRAAGQVEGAVTVSGLVRGSDEPGWFTPDNDASENYWFWRDLPAMAAAASVEAPALLVEADATPNPGGLPVGRTMRVELRNQHLQYAITWYALAGALAVIYVLSQRRPAAEA